MQRTKTLEKMLMLGKIEGRRIRGYRGLNEMVEWHHQLDGREFEQASGVDKGQGSLHLSRLHFPQPQTGDDDNHSCLLEVPCGIHDLMFTQCSEQAW